MFYKLNKRKKRISAISFRLPATKAVTTPTLAQVIGQFGFNMQEFLINFNKKSEIYIEHIKVKTLLYLLPNKKWKITLSTPSYIQLIKAITDLIKCSKISKISFFWIKKKLKFTNKYRYKLKRRKHWRGKITLRHVYTIFKTINNLDTSTNKIDLEHNLIKCIINELRSIGIYLLKPQIYKLV